MCSRPSRKDQAPHCQRGMNPLVSNTSRKPSMLSLPPHGSQSQRHQKRKENLGDILKSIRNLRPRLPLPGFHLQPSLLSSTRFAEERGHDAIAEGSFSGGFGLGTAALAALALLGFAPQETPPTATAAPSSTPPSTPPPTLSGNLPLTVSIPSGVTTPEQARPF